MASTAQQLRGLILSAHELQQMTDWPDALIEDYLNILNNLIDLANEIDLKNNILKTTTNVTSSPYTILDTDEEIFFDTDAAPITALLPAGIDGTNYRMINVGRSKNDVTLTPNGTDLLFGVNATERIADNEVIEATFETDEGWF
jgi:hypothetical protein